MTREEFEDYIYDEYDVPYNSTLAPEMLDGILNYASEIYYKEDLESAHHFLSVVLPSIRRSVIEEVEF